KVSVKKAEDIDRNIEVIARKEVPNQEVKTVIEGIKDVDTIYLIWAIETMTRAFYKREHIKKEGPIYSYDKLKKVFQADKNFKNFLDKLYLVAKPLEHVEKTMDYMKKLIIYICYLLALLNNTKINFFNLM
ncbi:2393_t:CDS:1, partial [Gigaspora margarita]